MSKWMEAGLPNLTKLEEFDWVQAMMACPQDPLFHAEGDVWTHTKMVLQALLDLPECADLPERAKFVLSWAAILHDVGKPETTQTIDGYIRSPRHTSVGEKMARQILWDLDLEVREEICSLVRLHGKPVRWNRLDQPHRFSVLASQRVPNYWLYLFDRADMLGRICKEETDFLDNLELYREICKETNSWEDPYQFDNGHSQFRYFFKEEEWPVDLYDDTNFEVILLSGLPGSGKDTYANQFDLPMISLDEIREELGIRFNDRKAQGKVAQLAYDRAKTYAAKKQSFIWNSTNLTKDLRMRILRTLSVYNPHFRWVYLETSYANVLERRAAAIPRKKLQAMYRMLDFLMPYEGHTVEYLRRD